MNSIWKVSAVVFAVIAIAAVGYVASITSLSTAPCSATKWPDADTVTLTVSLAASGDPVVSPKECKVNPGTFIKWNFASGIDASLVNFASDPPEIQDKSPDENGGLIFSPDLSSYAKGYLSFRVSKVCRTEPFRYSVRVNEGNVDPNPSIIIDPTHKDCVKG
jgi:hypothetical protein